MADTQHQWVVVVVYELADADVEKYADRRREEPVLLDGSKLVQADGPACFRCERTYREAKGTQCLSTDRRLERRVTSVTPSGYMERVDQAPR